MTTSKRSGIQYWHKIVVLLCLGWTVMWIYRPVLTAIFPEVQATIGPQSNTSLGFIASCYFFAYTAMQIPAGMLVDRFGKRAVVIPGFKLFAIAALLIATTIFFITNFGMSSSVIAPPLTGYLADITGTKITGFYVAIAILLIATTIFFITNMRYKK